MVEASFIALFQIVNSKNKVEPFGTCRDTKKCVLEDLGLRSTVMSMVKLERWLRLYVRHGSHLFDYYIAISMAHVAGAQILGNLLHRRGKI